MSKHLSLRKSLALFFHELVEIGILTTRRESSIKLSKTKDEIIKYLDQISSNF